MKAALAQAYKKTYFLTNSLRLLPGILITVLALWLASRGGSEGTVFIMLWLSGWSAGVMFLIVTALRASRDGSKGAVVLWAMAAVFSFGEIIGLGVLGHLAGYALIPIFLALIATNVAFYGWLKAPTVIGAKLLDRINGFRWYLGVAEKQALDARYRPESQPEKF
ncbi:MAG: hypothetical protein L0H70_06625, partial [Xanthomonadales bacterium]|nr:hypothetical protein [Xanthomonadales bacterium]